MSDKTLYQSVDALLMRWRDDAGQDRNYREIKAELADALEEVLLAAQAATQPPASDAGEDTARLDWLEECAKDMDRFLFVSGNAHGREWHDIETGEFYPTLRAAIDAAKAAQHKH